MVGSCCRLLLRDMFFHFSIVWLDPETWLPTSKEGAFLGNIIATTTNLRSTYSEPGLLDPWKLKLKSCK